MAKNMAVNLNIPTAIFSLEMSNLQLVNRLISNACEVEGEKIKSGRLLPNDWDKLMAGVKPLYNAPLFIDDTPSLSISSCAPRPADSCASMGSRFSSSTTCS